MVGRGLRWLSAVCAGACGFAVVWWVAEVVFDQERSTSVTISAAAASLLATPFIFWASQSPAGTGGAVMPTVNSPATSATPGPSAAAGRPPVIDHGVTPRPTNRGTVIAAAVAVLVVACIGTQVYNALIGDGRTPGNDPIGGDRPAGEAQTVEVNKTAWYAGYKFSFGHAVFSPEEEEVTVTAVAENLGLRNVTFDLEATFSSGNQHFGGHNRDSPIIPGGQRADVVFEFTVERLDGKLADGVLTFGDASKARTVVPLGHGPGLVTHEPRQVLANRTVTLRDLTFELTLCEVRGDIVPDHRQAPAGHLAIACWVNARYDGVGSFHYYDEDQFRLRLPDGNVVGPTAYPIMNLDRGVPVPNTYVAFLVKEPVKGAYAIQLVDLHTSSETESPATVKNVPLTL